MTRLRRIVLNGVDTSEKLRIIGKCARLLIEYGKRDPQVRELAVRTVSSCRGKDALCEVKTLHAYVRDNVRYIKDIANVERFATPQRTLFLEKSGDCDDSSIALSALLESIGYETRLVLVDPQLTKRFSHVIAQVLLDDKWHWTETTRKVPFDWKPPFTISYIVDKDSAGDEAMKELDDLFSTGRNLGCLGRTQGRGRNVTTTTRKMPAGLENRKKQIRDVVINRMRTGKITRGQATTAMRRLGEINDLGELEELGWSFPKISIPKITLPKISLPVFRPAPSPPRPVSTPPKAAPLINRILSIATQARNVATAVQKKAVQAVSQPTKPLLNAIAQKAEQTRTTLVKQAQTALATQQKLTDQKKAATKNLLQDKWDSVQDLIKKGSITAQQGMQAQQKLKDQAMLAAEKLKNDLQKKNAVILAAEAQKEKEIAAKQVELVKKVSKEPAEKVTSEYDPYRGNWVQSEEGDIIRPGGERGYWSKEPPRPEFRLERRLKMGQQQEPKENVTSEYDPNRGNWVQSEEGDIIRPGGERGYWSKEPPRPEFRQERRTKLAQEKQASEQSAQAATAPAYTESASQFSPQPEPSSWQPEQPAPEPAAQPEQPSFWQTEQPAPEEESVTEPASEETYSEEGGEGDFEMGGLGSAGLGIWNLGATKKKTVKKLTVKKPIVKQPASVLLKPKPGETQAQKNLRMNQNVAILRARAQATKRAELAKKGECSFLDIGCQAKQGADKLVKVGAILAGLVIGAWVVKDVIIAKVTKK